MNRHGSLNIGSLPAGINQGRFARMFPHLPSLPYTKAIEKTMMEIGRPGGVMDALDDPSASPKDLIVDPALNLHNPNSSNPGMTAGMTFLGQFIDHDITFDPTSSLERQQDPESIVNFRSPALELDNVYGPGPGAAPHLFDQRDARFPGLKFLVEVNPGSGALSRDGQDRFDLPRNSQSVALIADPRNDENLVISQLHLAFLRFHNAVLEDLASSSPLRGQELFKEAQRLVRWHYQWIILHDFLPTTVGQPVIDDIRSHGLKFYRWTEPVIPVEHAVAAYRFGHSQVRPSYRVNFDPAKNTAFFARIFDASLPVHHADPEDMRGGRRAPRRFIDWQTFFDFKDGEVKPNKRIDIKLSSPLTALLGFGPEEPQSLPQRNLLRSLALQLPAGQDVATRMGLPALSAADLDVLKPFHLHTRTPLWFYVLHEADVVEDGQRLGPVGARIVAEVFLGLLKHDPLACINLAPRWKPKFGLKPGEFHMTDLLHFAGVAPAPSR